MMYEVIATGSTGNAVVINGNILIDCGVPFKTLKGCARALQLVLLTHEHSDHFNLATVRVLAKQRPTLRWGCCEWMVPKLIEAGVDTRRIDVLELRQYVGYKGIAMVCPERLTHNVPNCGYHLILPNSERVFYATDTGTLDGVDAPGYDLYLVECNHTKEEIEERIARKKANGEFAYEYAAARNHLSYEQVTDWLYSQMWQKSKYAFLHQHKEKEDHDTVDTDILQPRTASEGGALG